MTTTTPTADGTTHHALGWELQGNDKGVTTVRIVVAQQYLLHQTTEEGNARPRWHVDDAGGADAASERALALTAHAETEYAAKLAVHPVEVVVHDSELAALTNGGSIPDPLRARVFSAFKRGRRTV